MCLQPHTHTHSHTRIHTVHTHLYKMFHDSLTISLQYRDANATVLPLFHSCCFWLEPKIHCREQVINCTPQWTTNSFMSRLWQITGWKRQRKALIRNSPSKFVVSVFYLSACMCVLMYIWVCGLSFMSKSTAKNDSDITVAFAVKRWINYLYF